MVGVIIMWDKKNISSIKFTIFINIFKCNSKGWIGSVITSIIDDGMYMKTNNLKSIK